MSIAILALSLFSVSLVQEAVPAGSEPSADRSTEYRVRAFTPRPNARGPRIVPGGAGGTTLAATPATGQDLCVTCSVTGPQAETTIAVNPSNPDHIVVASIDWSSGVQATGFSTTLDGGSTWTHGVIPVEPGFVVSADPIAFFDAQDQPHVVVLHAFGAPGNAFDLYSSTDGGLTFPGRTRINANSRNDKEQIAVDRSGGPRHGDIAMSFGRFTSFGGTTDNALVTVSSDDGATWSKPVRVNDANSSGNQRAFSNEVAYGPGGELYVMWPDTETDEILVDVSLDGGVTFGVDQLVATHTPPPNPLPGTGFDFKSVYHMEADATGGPFDGNLYVVYHTWTAGPGSHADVYCATSTDGGSTWSSVRVHPGAPAPSDQFYPVVDVDPFGGVNVLYHSNALDPGRFLLGAMVARSTDGGATFTEVPVSDALFDPNANEFGGAFLGHYNDIGSTPDSVLACWAACPPGTNSLSVYLDPVNFGLSTDVATLSAATGGVATFQIDVGPNLAGETYVVLGSASGTTPGLDLGSVHLPLNFDLFWSMTLRWANLAPFPNTFGKLDMAGRAVAQFDTLGPFSPSYAGFDLDFAVLVGLSPPRHASRATRISLIP